MAAFQPRASLLLALVLAGCGFSTQATSTGTGGAGNTGGSGTGGETSSTGSTGAGGDGGATTTSTTTTSTSGGNAHAVGGTVTGLAGAGLVLQNNGGNDLPIPADGSFVFSGLLMSGAGYDVTVLDHPMSPAQTCEVAMGKGTIDTTDVNDVTVTCATNSYDVGGSVTGLIGTGLVLQNNGANDLPIMMNGPFTFGASLSGQDYDVTVLTPPQSPAQTCKVQNGKGKVGGADVAVFVECSLVDGDGDGVPDLADPFPTDPTKPKVAKPGLVYPHTSSTLFTMDTTTYAINQIGAFKGSTFTGQVTDVAIDQYGVLYAITFNDLYVCDATTAACDKLASLPQSFNGLTMVPPGTLHPFLDTLVGIANSGAWYKVTLTGAAAAQLTAIGGYGTGYASSGDVFSIEGVGTFAAVDKSGQAYDYIVAVDPKTGAVQSEVGALTGYSTVYGLAGWQGVVFGFDSSGAVLKIDITNGTTQVLAQTSNVWWGAGVATRLAVP